MSQIDDLISQHCPGGVEFKTIGEIAECYSGVTPMSRIAAYWEGGTVPWMRSGEVNKGIIYDTTKKMTQAGFDSCSTKMVPPNAVVIALDGQGKTRGIVARTRISLCISEHLCSIICSETVNSDFLYHFLATQYQELRNVSYGDGTRGRLNLQMIRSYRIPVPPIEVQREIVKVLDTFSKLEAELEAELGARRQQYTYYRDLLTTFDEHAYGWKQGNNDVRWVTLGEIATIVRGASPRPIHSFLEKTGNGVPWIKIGDAVADGKYITDTAECVTAAGAAKSRRVYPGDFVLSNSMSFGRPYILKIEGCIHDGWLALSDFNNSFTTDFLYHLLRSTPVQAEFSRRVGAGTVQNLNADIVKSVVVPVLPLGDQARIVAILDKFDVMVNDLSSGLPAEIKARRQQYAHYRDRLLTFKEAV